MDVVYSETFLNWILNKIKIWTLNKVPMWEIFVNLTYTEHLACVFWTQKLVQRRFGLDWFHCMWEMLGEISAVLSTYTFTLK
jgi:hypothetical protein